MSVPRFISVLTLFSFAFATTWVHAQGCIEDTLALQRGRVLIMRGAIGNLDEKLSAPGPHDAQADADIRKKIELLQTELDNTLSRVPKLLAEATAAGKCGADGVITNQAAAYLGSFQEWAYKAGLPAESSRSFFGMTWDEFSHNGDQVIYGETRGVIKAFKSAGLEVVNVTVDAETVALIGVFDPQSGQYYELRSGLSRSLDQRGLKATAKGIVPGMYNGIVKNGLSGDPEKTGEALGNLWIMEIGSTMTLSKASNIASSLAKAGAEMPLSVPKFGYAPSAQATATLVMESSEVNVLRAVAPPLGLLGGAGPLVTSACMMQTGGAGGAAAASEGGSPGLSQITDRYAFPKQPPGENLSPAEIAKMESDVEAGMASHESLHQVKKDVQAWLDDMNSPNPKNMSKRTYSPGENPTDTIRDVSQFTPAKIRNALGQMKLSTDPTMAAMMIKLKGWASWRETATIVYLLERLLKDVQK